MDNYTRAIAVDRIIDGDTIVTESVDLGYHTAVHGVTYRLARVNTPELRAKDQQGKAAAFEARRFTADWLSVHEHHDGLFATSTKTDDWRRWIGEITCGQGHNLSDDLLSTGHAVPYKG